MSKNHVHALDTPIGIYTSMHIPHYVFILSCHEQKSCSWS